LGVRDEEAWLAFGIVEELTTHLQRIEGLTLRAAPRGVPGGAERETRDVREIGRVLDVDAVVGCVLQRKSADDVRVHVRVLTVEDGFQLWARTFACPAAKIGRVAD